MNILVLLLVAGRVLYFNIMVLSLKRLAGDTVIYGVTTMIGRLLNWFLMPFYIRVISQDEYGAVNHIYGIITILLVIFTFGLETGFFRFARSENKNVVYGTTIAMLLFTSMLLVVLSFGFSEGISNYFYNGKYRDAVVLMGLIVAIDSLVSIPFAKLRLDNRPIFFGVIKIASIFCNILFNILFLVFIPFLIAKFNFSNKFTIIYESLDGVFFILLSNLLSSILTLVFFLPDILRTKGSFSAKILKSMMIYSWPVLVVGITGMITQNAEKILMPKLISENGFTELAIYGANFKIGILMSLFTQSFRFAFEPFFFNNRDKGIESYAKVMEYFIGFGLLILLGICFSMDLVNSFILTSAYYRGNLIIPYVLLGLLFYGIYFNLSLWYKLSDKTYFGAFFGFIGMIITVGLDFILIGKIGMLGGAIALLCGYSVMMVVSYLVGQRHYRVPYNVKRIALYFFVAGSIYVVYQFVSFESLFFNYAFKVLLIASYVLFFLLSNGFKLKRTNVKG